MAGTLLLIPKVEKSATNDAIYSHVVKTILGNYQSHFRDIQTKETPEGSLLVQFRHDDREKYFESPEGWVTFEGTVFDLNETKALSPQDLWNLYQSFGTSMANQLDGHFVIKLFDRELGEYFVINDFIKNKTNFICESDDYILFTPFAAMSGAIISPSLDHYAYNEFMWRYYIMSFRSMLKGVQKLQPASIYTVKDGSLFAGKHIGTSPHEFTKIAFS